MKRYIVKTDEQIELIRQSCLLVSKTLAEIKKHIRPGVSTKALDKIAEEFIRSHGAEPAFLNYAPPNHKPFPATICASPNDVVVHGVPSEKVVLKEGDIISVDVGVKLNGWYGDSAYTFTVGEVAPEVLRLLHVTKESLYKGVEQAYAGSRVGNISHAVSGHVTAHGFSVVREMVGHGLGKSLHEEPSIPNTGVKRGQGVKLIEGLVIAIEPMINMGVAKLKIDPDGWTAHSADGKPSAHYEHTVAVRRGKAEILTTFEFIEAIA
ncbi:MAG: type I methionyl aminopeptidase [Bacteroidia bacterium]|nr:type I methionyl aminopeptidase [Bacteroidia bacterium]MDW8332678.1 type I methionyl aminopeptidase [Bacteroidia bacterium]